MKSNLKIVQKERKNAHGKKKRQRERNKGQNGGQMRKEIIM
jgi:hypothetical protein